MSPIPTTARAVDDTTHLVPRWVRMAAWAVPLCVLPSALWRLALVFGAFEGQAPPMGDSWAERLYVPGLSVVSVGLGLLTLGLVHRWGEVVPSWVPRLGGRTVPVRAAYLPAVTGAGLLMALCAYAVLNAHFHFVTRVRPLIGEDRDGADITGTAEQLGVWAYAPLVLWGPLLLVVAESYRRRRRRAQAPSA